MSETICDAVETLIINVRTWKQLKFRLFVTYPPTNVTE